MLTKIKVVNLMLSAVGDSPVNSLSGEDVYPEALECERIVDDLTESIQYRGWNFNTNVVTLPKDFNNEIDLPADAAVVYAKKARVAMRGNKLMDLDTNSFEFTGDPPELTIISVFDFDVLPEVAKNYIKMKSVIQYHASRSPGSIPAYQESDVLGAWILLGRMEGRKVSRNWFSKNITRTANSGLRRRR